MRPINLKTFLITIVILLTVSQPAYASGIEEVSREEVFSHLKKAFEAQVSLTEKPRTKEEIRLILSSYFDHDLIEKYMEENLQPLEGKYIVYGTDFPYYTIPFFTYGNDTVIHQADDILFVYEHFPASDGPVAYEAHYELVKLMKTNDGWKVYVIETNIEKVDSILNEGKKNKNVEEEMAIDQKEKPEFITQSSFEKESEELSFQLWKPLYIPYYYFQTKILLTKISYDDLL